MDLECVAWRRTVCYILLVGRYQSPVLEMTLQRFARDITCIMPTRTRQTVEPPLPLDKPLTHRPIVRDTVPRNVKDGKAARLSWSPYPSNKTNLCL